MEPIFAIHNISIVTDDDIIQFGDDVNIYHVYLSRAIIIWGNCLNWLEKTIVQTIFLSFFLKADLATHLWPLSVHAKSINFVSRFRIQCHRKVCILMLLSKQQRCRLSENYLTVYPLKSLNIRMTIFHFGSLKY